MKRSFFVFDEIASYASPGMVDLANKSRSANITCFFATQSPSDLDSTLGPTFKEQMIENCNNLIVMRQNSAINANYLSEIIGTTGTMGITHQLHDNGLDISQTGFGSARSIREFICPPDDIKNFRTGEAFFLSKDTGACCKIKIHKPF